MTNIDSRVERAKKEVSGNESLVDMLEGDSASELFNWGTALAASITRTTDGMNDSAAEAALAPRLKALRQALRSIGNWAAGKYADPADRAQLKEKLLEQLRLVLGETSRITTGELSGVIDCVDAPDMSPHALILKLKELIEKTE
jgi:hypothetical protein